MVFIVQFAIFAAYVFSVVALVRRHSIRGTLTSRRFAVIFACTFGLMIGLVYFSGLLMRHVAISPRLARLGLGIVLINGIVAYPASYLGHRYLLRKAIAQLFAASGDADVHRDGGTTPLAQ
jgi:hypothetical protein